MNSTPKPTPSWVGPRRFVEQKWLLDANAKTIGGEIAARRAASCGPEAAVDLAEFRARVNKMADIPPAFEAIARRREERARAAEETGDAISARNNFYIASIFWGASQWTLVDNSEQNLNYNARKRECFERYARLADHRIEAAWIPFHGKRLPGWFHLPPGYSGGRIKAIVLIPGMDGFKEHAVTLHADRWLQSGFAVLAVEGPGQTESPVLGIRVDMPSWVETGPLLMDWMHARPEVDPERVGISGSSFGSFFATICASHEPRFRACTVQATCLEPGCHTIFEEALPTFKQRFMYMANITDERAFDEFAKTITWEGHAQRMRAPYLCLAGESDDLSPLAHTERMFGELKCPKQLVVYQGAIHGLRGVPSVSLGPQPAAMLTTWMDARLASRPLASESWFVQANGQVVKSAY
jgi:dienelactone hydrolase